MTKQAYNIDGKTVYLATGRANGRPVVIVGLRLSKDMPNLASITAEFPMKTEQRARDFVRNATEETARRGLKRLESEFGDLISAVNSCLSRSVARSQLMAIRGKI